MHRDGCHRSPRGHRIATARRTRRVPPHPASRPDPVRPGLASASGRGGAQERRHVTGGRRTRGRHRTAGRAPAPGPGSCSRTRTASRLDGRAAGSSSGDPDVRGKRTDVRLARPRDLFGRDQRPRVRRGRRMGSRSRRPRSAEPAYQFGTTGTWRPLGVRPAD